MSGRGGAQRKPEDAGEEIEMTTFKVWGRRLPGGAAEIDRDEAESRGKLFASFPDDFRTYEDAARTKVSGEQLKALGEAMKDMIAKARALKQGMEDRGEPIDFDRIEAEAFGDLPRGLIPPEFVRELQSWRKVRDAMNARAVMAGAAPEGRAEKIKGGLDKAGIAVALTKAGLGNIPGLGEKAAAAIEHVNEALEAVAQALEAGGFGIDAHGAAVDGAAPGKGPVELKLADAKLMEAMKGLAGLGADVIAKFVPVVSVFKNGTECLAAIKDTVERTKLRAGAGDLRDEAMLDTTSQLSRAFEQAQGREGRLAVEGGITATTSGLSTAGGIATATVVGAKVGAALEVTSTAISIAGKVVLGGYDEVGARKAVATLKAAQAGSTKAQEEVFSDHAHYAKMLIAVMAMDGDKMAKTYLLDRGLDESDLANPLTTADILFDYAVYHSKETDEPASKIDAAVALAKKAATGIEELGDTCAAGLRRLVGLKAKPVEAPVEIVHLPSAAVIRDTWAEVDEVKEAQRAFMATMGKPDPNLGAHILELVQGLAALQVQFFKLEKAAGIEADRAEAALKAGKTDGELGGKALAERARALRAEEASWQALRQVIEDHGA